MKAKDIDTRIPEGRLLVAAVYVLLQSGPSELRGKPSDEILDQLEQIAAALD